jgi:WD40 repeat protein
VRSWTIETRLGRLQARAVAFNPRDGRLACSSADGTVRIYQRGIGRLEKALLCPAEVLSLAWSPDGARLATGASDRLVRLWQVKEGRVVRSYPGHQGAVQCLAWSPDGKWLASGGEDSSVRLWQVESGKALSPFQGHGNGVAGLAWSADGKRLASNEEGLTIIWDVPSGTAKHQIDTGSRIQRSVAWSRSGKELALVRGRAIQVWDVNQARVVRQWDADGYSVYTLARSPDGKWLASLGHDGGVKVWDAGTGEQLRDWRAPVVNFSAQLDWAPDSRTLAISSWDGIRVYHSDSDEVRHHLPDHGEGGWELALAPDRRRLATLHRDGASGSVRLWEIDSAALAQTLPVSDTWLGALAWSPDGKWLGTGSVHGVAHLVDLASGTRHDLEDSPRPNHVSWSPDGKVVAVCDGDGNARLYDATTFQLLRPLNGGGPFSRTTWSEDSRWLAAATDDDNPVVRLFEARTGKYSPLGEVQGAVWGLAFAPGGKLLASGGRDRVVRLWDVQKRQLSRHLPGHIKGVTALAWAPGGKVLASGSRDRTVRLWDAGTGKVRHVLEDHPAGVERLSWSPDGKTLAAYGGGTLILWNAETGRKRHRLSGVGGHGLAWAHAGTTLVAAAGSAAVQLWDPATGRLRCTLVNLGKEQGLAVTADGHFAGTPRVGEQLVYVIDTGRGQETLTPAEFARRFHWKNDPTRVRLGAP